MKSGIKYKKPYYLADHMNFILPFTKLRSQSQEDMKYYGEVVKQTDFEDNKVIYVNPEVRNDDDCDSRFDFQTEMTYPNVVYDSNDHLTSNEGRMSFLFILLKIRMFLIKYKIRNFQYMCVIRV